VGRGWTLVLSAFAAAAVFQFLATVLASLLTPTASHGAPLPAGHASFMFFGSGESDALAQVIDVALTTAVFVIAARRSVIALAGATLLGIIVFAGVLLVLTDGEQLLAHVAWWTMAMLPALAFGLLPRIR
jgi:hypothetical protein